MKILAVGMNYAKHIDEIHTKEEKKSLLEKEPVLFSKFDSSIIQPGKPFFVPDFADRFDYETEIVVKIAHVGKDISATCRANFARRACRGNVARGSTVVQHWANSSTRKSWDAMCRTSIFTWT